MKEMRVVKNTMKRDCRHGGVMNLSFVNVCLTDTKIKHLGRMRFKYY